MGSCNIRLLRKISSANGQKGCVDGFGRSLSELWSTQSQQSYTLSQPQRSYWYTLSQSQRSYTLYLNIRITSPCQRSGTQSQQPSNQYEQSSYSISTVTSLNLNRHLTQSRQSSAQPQQPSAQSQHLSLYLNITFSISTSTSPTLVYPQRRTNSRARGMTMCPFMCERTTYMVLIRGAIENTSN